MSVFCRTCGFLEPCKCRIVRCKAGEGIAERNAELERQLSRVTDERDKACRALRMLEHLSKAALDIKPKDLPESWARVGQLAKEGME